MHKTIIIDDEIQVARDLEGMIKLFCPYLEVVGTAHTADEGKELINLSHPEIVFLDIQLDSTTGFELLSELGHHNFQLIFVTAYQDYALEAFKFSAIDYLLKPVDSDELMIAVDKALEKANQSQLASQVSALLSNLGQEFKPKKIVLTDLEGVHVIDVPEILWCHANGSYTEFQLANGDKKMVSKHLKTYENMLHKHNFYRIHRSYLINANAIIKIDRAQGVVQMKNNLQLPVSIAPDMLKVILDYLQD